MLFNKVFSNKSRERIPNKIMKNKKESLKPKEESLEDPDLVYIKEMLRRALAYEPKEHECLESKPAVCPLCGSSDIADYVFGYPVMSFDPARRIDPKKIILGGCVLPNFPPEWRCTHCNTDFFLKR